MENKEGILKRLWQRGKRAFGVLTANKYSTIAGALAFFLIMSFVPFLFFLVLLFTEAGLSPESVLELELFGWARDIIILFIENAEGAKAAGAGIVFLLTTLWSSTSFFYHLRRSGEILYNYRRLKKGWKVRISAILLTLAVLLYFLAAGAILIGTTYFARRLPKWLFYIVVYSLVLAIGFCSAWILNTYICPYRCKATDTLIGSLMTAIAWLVASGVFSVYFALGNMERLYGALTFVVVFLIWVYWMMICFTAGVLYNRHHMKVKGMQPKKL